MKIETILRIGRLLSILTLLVRVASPIRAEWSRLHNGHHTAYARTDARMHNITSWMCRDRSSRSKPLESTKRCYLAPCLIKSKRTKFSLSFPLPSLLPLIRSSSIDKRFSINYFSLFHHRNELTFSFPWFEMLDFISLRIESHTYKRGSKISYQRSTIHDFEVHLRGFSHGSRILALMVSTRYSCCIRSFSFFVRSFLFPIYFSLFFFSFISFSLFVSPLFSLSVLKIIVIARRWF